MALATQVVRIEDPASWRAIQAVVWYFSNQTFETFWREVFGNEVPTGTGYEAGYAEGWRQRFIAGVAAVWGFLDRAHRNKLIEVSLARYGADIDVDIYRANERKDCEGCGAPGVIATDCGGGLTYWCASCHAKGE